MFKSVIFDMDGVLVNGADSFSDVSGIFQEQGIELNYDYYAPSIRFDHGASGECLMIEARH